MRQSDSILERFQSLARSSASAPQENLRIEGGEMRDYQALSRFHYRSARPGVVTAIYRMVHESQTIVGRYVSNSGSRQVVGVLLRSLPHLGCALRNIATNDRYRTGLHPREQARVLNREMRTISRVVVHPQWRGLGLAVMLVRHALMHPEPGQVFTEALAAMGHVHPFFERAGMTRYDRPPRREHARLLDAIARLGVRPSLLASPQNFLTKLRERDELTQVWFEHELARWCASGARRKRSRGRETASEERDVEAMLTLARDQLLSLPVYYLYHHHESEESAHADDRS